MKHINFVKDSEINVFVGEALFSKDAVFKCLYWYGDKFHTTVGFADSNTYQITIRPFQNSGIKEDELPFYLQKLERDLVDFQLRDAIAKETQNIRELLVAKAFSNGELDEQPPGDVTDPVGFNPYII